MLVNVGTELASDSRPLGRSVPTSALVPVPGTQLNAVDLLFVELTQLAFSEFPDEVWSVGCSSRALDVPPFPPRSSGVIFWEKFSRNSWDSFRSGLCGLISSRYSRDLSLTCFLLGDSGHERSVLLSVVLSDCMTCFLGLALPSLPS